MSKTTLTKTMTITEEKAEIDLRKRFLPPAGVVISVVVSIIATSSIDYSQSTNESVRNAGGQTMEMRVNKLRVIFQNKIFLQ